MSPAAIAKRSRSPLVFWNTRAAVVIAGIVCFLGVLNVCAPTAAIVECDVLLTDGGVAAIWTAAACGLGAFVLRRAKIRANPLLFVASSGGLGLGIFSLLGLSLGLAGWLNRGTALAMPLAGVVLVFVDLLKNRAESNVDPIGWLGRPTGFAWVWLVPVISLAFAAVAASVMPGQLWKPLDPHPYDVMSYHLQVPREWYEANRIVPLSHNVFSYFPFNVEMQFLLLMHVMGGAWKAMYASQFISLAFTVLMVLAIAGSVSADGNPAVAAAMAAVVPWVIMLAGVAYVESGLLLYTTLAIAWALAHFQRCDLRAMSLAGVMAGFACGVKITAVPMLLLALPIALFITAVVFRPPKMSSLIIACALFVIAGLVVLSPWLIRNLIWSGNPLFPVAMRALGHGHFSLDQVERFRLAHSPTANQQPAAARLAILWTDVVAHWQFGYVLFPAALLAAARQWRHRETWILLITGTIMLIVWIGFTHLLPRFLVTLVPIAAILVGNIRWGKAWPVGILLVVVAGIFGWFGVYPPLTYITRDPVGSYLIGVRDLSFILPRELADMKNSDKQVGLVGDAEAFLYQVPMNRLHYRTVFDVPGDISDPITAWVGPHARGDPNWLLVINPAEIERLHQTYWKIPSLPAKWAPRGPEPFVLRGDEVGSQ